MKLDVKSTARQLGSDPTLTDYDIWRARKMVDDELYKIDRCGGPIPMQLLYARGVLELVRTRRRRHNSR
jgi:hypothetical protein